MGPYVHRDLTQRWALRAGLTDAEARAIARACLAVDERWPGRTGPMAMSRHLAPPAWLWASRLRRRAIATGSLETLGWSLHSAQDALTHGPLGLAHVRHLLGMLDRDPDDWNAAPQRIKDAIERRTMGDLERFARARAASAGRPPSRAAKG